MALAKGIRRTPDGFQVYVRHGGRLYSRRLRGELSLTELKKEREKLKAKVVLGIRDAETAAAARTFADDAAEYLKLVEGMPSFRDRHYRIGRWVLEFGRRQRTDITGRDIAAVLEKWRKKGDGAGPLSPASLNQRRTALMHLFTKMDGRSAANPVKDVAPYDERHSRMTRAQPLAVCYRLLARIGRRKWKHRRRAHQGTRQAERRTRARLRVLLWTGLPHKQLTELLPEHIDWKRERIWVTRRLKGKGVEARWVPVVPPAIAALKRFAALNCWGPFSNSSMHSALQRAIAAENTWRARWRHPPLPPMRPYDLRHSFGTWAASVIKDDRALKELLRTNSIEVYTEGAVSVRLEHARAALTAALGAKVAGKVAGQSKAG